MKYFIYLISILALSVLVDTLIIKKKGSYKGWLKATILSAFYSLIAVAILFKQPFWNDEKLWWDIQGWDWKFVYAISSAVIWTTIKDIAMFITLRKKSVLGSGKWDQLWKKWPDPVLTGFKLVFMGFFIHFIENTSTITSEKWVMFGIYCSIYLFIITVQYFKIKKAMKDDLLKPEDENQQQTQTDDGDADKPTAPQ